MANIIINFPTTSGGDPETLPWATDGVTLEPTPGQEANGWQPQAIAGPPDYRLENYARYQQSQINVRGRQGALFLEYARAEITLAGFAAGVNQRRITVNGHNFDATDAVDLNTTRDGLVAAINSDPLVSIWVFAESTTGGKLRLTDRTPGNTYTVSPSLAVSVLAGAGTITISSPATTPIVREDSAGQAANLVIGSTQIDHDGNAAHDGRVIWQKSKRAFRAGHFAGTEADDANIGTNSIALGDTAKASGADSHAYGTSSLASAAGAIAVGSSSTANGVLAVAVGSSATATGAASIALQNASALGASSLAALGANTTNVATGAIAMGSGSTGSGNNTVALGDTATASASHAISIGDHTTALGAHSIAMGDAAVASNGHAVAVGNGATASGLNSTAIGAGGIASGASSISLNGGTASGTSATTISTAGDASGAYAMALAAAELASGDYSLAIGNGAKAINNGEIAMNGAPSPFSGNNRAQHGWVHLVCDVSAGGTNELIPINGTHSMTCVNSAVYALDIKCTANRVSGIADGAWFNYRCIFYTSGGTINNLMNFGGGYIGANNAFGAFGVNDLKIGTSSAGLVFSLSGQNTTANLARYHAIIEYQFVTFV